MVAFLYLCKDLYLPRCPVWTLSLGTLRVRIPVCNTPRNKIILFPIWRLLCLLGARAPAGPRFSLPTHVTSGSGDVTSGSSPILMNSFFDARALKRETNAFFPRYRKITDEAFFGFAQGHTLVWQREKPMFSTDLFIALPQQPSALQTKR